LTLTSTRYNIGMSDTPIKVQFWSDYTIKHPTFTGCLIDKDNDKAWFKNGEYHRTNGPAIECANGSKVWWFKNGEYHRTDGPACEFDNGYKEWWLNGKYHRTDGPAVEYADGSKEWYLKGKELTEQEHRSLVRQMKMKLLDIGQHSL